MKYVPKQKFLELAKKHDWSPAFAEGYVDGEAFRKRSKAPPKFLLVAIDEYSLGFRAGYFERRGAPANGAGGPQRSQDPPRRRSSLEST